MQPIIDSQIVRAQRRVPLVQEAGPDVAAFSNDYADGSEDSGHHPKNSSTRGHEFFKILGTVGHVFKPSIKSTRRATSQNDNTCLTYKCFVFNH